jgi:hypothetical protein
LRKLHIYIYWTNWTQSPNQAKGTYERDIRNNKEPSAIAQHIDANSSHKMNFTKAELFHKEPGYFASVLKEGLFINKESTAMNGTGGLRINPIWTATLLPLLRRN